jgi:hypothetical protein
MTRSGASRGEAPSTDWSGGRSVARARRRWAWFGTVGPVLTLADAAAVLLAGLVAGCPDGPLLAATGTALLVGRAADLHRSRLVLSIVPDLPGLVVAAAAATTVLVATGSPAVTALLVLACLVLAHTLVLAGTGLLRTMGRFHRRVLVVGTGEVARRLALTLLERADLGLRPVGFVGTGSADPLGQARGLPLPLLGPVSGLPRAMTESGVDTAVVALSGPEDGEVAAAVEGLLAATGDVYAVPDTFPASALRARHPRELVDGVPLVHLYARAAPVPVRAFKRLVEVVVAAATWTLLLPVFAGLAVLVRIETGGVLVRQPRDDGRTELRFRTRRARSVARPGTTFSVDIAGRPGPVGRVLRRTRLVALPEPMRALALRVRFAGGAPAHAPAGSAAPPRADEAQVDTGQLAG